MTKHVFDSQQCAHIWAAQSQDNGRNSSNSVSFVGPDFYSYRTVIASIRNVSKDATARDQRLVLINSNKYSMTTSSKHMPCVHRAIRGMDSVRVPFVEPARWDSSLERDRIHAANVAYLQSEVTAAEAKLRKCTDSNVHWWETQIIERYKDLQRYSVYFGLPISMPNPEHSVNGSIEHIRATRRTAQAKRETPAYLARKAKQDAAREAERVRLAGMTWQERHAEESAKRTAKYLAQREQALKDQEERAAKTREAQAQWCAGIGSLNGMYFAKENGSAYCRWNAERKQSETSQGAVVDYAQTVQALTFISNYCETLAKFNEEKWDAPADLHRVGPYFLRTIFANGSVQIGCHFIDKEELDKVRSALRLPL
jgi:hypothetical protein